jgi:hypothetical protein
LSFFDEADEPRVEPRTAARRRRPSGGGGSGGGRRPPSGGEQTIMTRRVIAAGAALVVIILIVLGVRSCQISARNSSLKDYANNVSALNQQSVQTGQQFFNQLSSGNKSGNGTGLQNQLNETRLQADNQLNKARGFDVPDEMKAAQSNFVLTMQMRRDGIAGVAAEIQQALGTTTSKDAVNAIAADMAKFYASDVLYKDYTTALVSGALKSAGIAVGGANGISIDGHQFLPDIAWLDPNQIASKLGASGTSTPTGPVAPGLHGHSLDSVSIGGTTLQTGSTNTIPANQAPTVTLNFTNGGTNNEKNVVCKVSISGTNLTAKTTVPQTTAGQTGSCQVTLPSAPPAGNYTLSAEIVPVPGEKKVDNNTSNFPITVQ